MSVFKIIHIDENENRSSDYICIRKKCVMSMISYKTADRIESF